jgi:hypothetical protein
MSLVSDALRKARAYATARDIQRHGAAAGSFSPPPRRSRLGLGLLLGAFIALAAAGAGAVFVLWALAQRDVATGGPAATAPGPRAAATPADTAMVPVQRERQRPAPATAPAGAPARATVAAPAAAAATQAAGTPGALPTADQPPGSPPPELRADANTAERVYVLRADLGYATLQLDFLVYKPGGGFGRVNGQDVAPGTIVDGFTVEEIGPDFIRLRDSRGPLVLRTR